jgi:hypothetical protein
MARFKLGKLPPKPAKFKLKKYLGPALPPPPTQIDWTMALTEDWGMDANDRYGDCVYVASAHILMLATAAGDGLVVPSAQDVLNAYSAGTGFDPSTDNGDTVVHGLQYMVTTGMCGQKCDAFAEVDKTDKLAMMQAIALFGALDVGVNLPQSAMDTFGKQVWSDIQDTRILGGHCVPVFAYDEQTVKLVTWGQEQFATWGWLLHYIDEAVAPLFFAWARNSVNCDPDGFDLITLETDLSVIPARSALSGARGIPEGTKK